MEQWSSRGGCRGRSSFVPPPSMETSSVVFGDAWVQRVHKKGTLINKILPEPGWTCSCQEIVFLGPFFTKTEQDQALASHSNWKFGPKALNFSDEVIFEILLETRYWICKKRRRYLTTKKHQATWRDDTGVAPPGWTFFFKFYSFDAILELQCAASWLMFFSA